MGIIEAPRSCTLKKLLAALSVGLFLASSFRTGDLLAAPQGDPTTAVGQHDPPGRNGIRNVFIKVTPGKQEILDNVWRNSSNLTGPKFAKLIDGKHPAVVRINVEGRGNVTYHGSGTLVAVSARHGIVITNWHVVRDGVGPITVRFPDGFLARAAVLKTDKTWDLAALAIARPRATPVKLAEKIPEIGDVLTVAGYGGGTYRQSSGRLLQYCAPGMTEPAEIIELTTAARNGDSGGPIFAQDGTLAGVLFGSISGTTNGSHSGRVESFLRPLLAQAPHANDRARGSRVLY